MIRSIFILFMLLALATVSVAQGKKEYYEIKVYRLKGKAQQEIVETFLKQAYIPALHRAGIANIGVFKPLESDSLNTKRIVVIAAYPTLDQFIKVQDALVRDKKFNEDGKTYLNAAYDAPPYERIESTILRAFSGMPQMAVPLLTNSRSERIYELRSYEGPTENIYRNKVKMFNDGDEVGLFKRLGFNAVFYADVISGSKMPNLMYLTTFSDMKSHDEHWKAFVDDPHWKRLIAMPEYQHNVSSITIWLLRPTEYSDY